MTDDDIAKLLEVGRLLDALDVPQRGRMVWDGQQMHGGTEMEAAAERAMLDGMVYGTGLVQHGPVVDDGSGNISRFTYVAYPAIHKPQTPAEGDVSRAIWGCPLRISGPLRVRPLVAALRRIYP